MGLVKRRKERKDDTMEDDRAKGLQPDAATKTDANPRHRRGTAVRCLETGVTFPTVKAAAEWGACSATNISSALVGKTKTTGGFHWVRASMPPERWKALIMCVDTQKKFSSLGEAAKWAGAGCSAAEIADCLAGRVEKAGGHGWAFQKPLTGSVKRPVMCLETAQAFPSVTAAARWAKINKSCISNALSGRTRSAGGFRWTYAETDRVPRSTHKKKR